MNPIRFRTATASDATPIADVYLKSRRECLPYAPLAHTEDDVRGWITNILLKTQDVTVMEEAGEIVGFIATARDAEGIGWIEHLYLLPSQVGRGIGAQFVAQAKSSLGSPVRLYTFQPNTGARRFYEQHGFVAIAFGDGSENEEGVPDVLYEWTTI